MRVVMTTSVTFSFCFTLRAGDRISVLYFLHHSLGPAPYELWCKQELIFA